LTTSGGFFDVPKKKELIKELEEKSTAADFWQDPQKARPVMRQLDHAKGTVELWTRLHQHVQDAAAHLDLAEEAKDEAEEKEAGLQIEKLVTELSELELRSLLNGPHDSSNAIITIHAGAGGTEAADWADMLLRMYTRWIERKGFQLETTDYLPGEGAGCMSAMLSAP
jgi:peptide chain release factor 2